MPDFNKGDNTQQGMNGEGWVWGGLDLNRKRLIFVAVTSDEEDEGLDSVYLKVHDDLNNLDYVVTGENLPVGESSIGGGEIPTLTITLKPAPEATVAELGAIASFNGTNYVKVPYSSISTDTDTEIIDLYYDLGGETTYMQYSAFSDVVTGVITGTYGDFVNCALNDWGDLIITDPTLPSSCSITFTAIGPR